MVVGASCWVVVFGMGLDVRICRYIHKYTIYTYIYIYIIYYIYIYIDTYLYM